MSGGLLQLNAWKDPQYQDKWVTGGLCQCKLAKTYGAYFVRSRVTGPGPNEVELLWPASNAWPPEIDFNETGELASTSSTVHFSTINLFDQRNIYIDMSQWHTWGSSGRQQRSCTSSTGRSGHRLSPRTRSLERA